MDITQMITLAEMQERERDMRYRWQSRELAESRHGRAASGLRDRIVRFAGTALPHRPVADHCAAGAAC
jgi:hypothetical protein